MAKKKETVEQTVDALLRVISFRAEEKQHLARLNTATAQYYKPENIDGVIIKYTSSDTDEHDILHHLGRTPSLIFLGIPDAAVSYHQSNVADKARIRLTASAETECTVRILVL